MPFLFVLAAMWGAAPDPNPKLVEVISGMARDTMAEGKGATELDMAARYCAVTRADQVPELPASYESGTKVAPPVTRKAMGIVAACMEDQGWIITNFVLKGMAESARDQNPRRP